MSVVQMTTGHQTRDEDWIKKFDPKKRFLRGRAYQLAKRSMDLFLVVVTIPFWLPLNGIIALVIRLTSPGAPVQAASHWEGWAPLLHVQVPDDGA